MATELNLSVTVEDVIQFLAEALQSKTNSTSAYGYDIYVPSVIRSYLRNLGTVPHHDLEQCYHDTNLKFGGIFLSAAWELSRIGVLRPGSIRCHAQEVDGIQGFSLTPYGLEWIKSWDNSDFSPASYHRFLSLISPYKGTFGDGYFQRAREAISCYQSQLYLASCSMSGAAAESIVLFLGIRQLGEDQAIKIYYASQGRKKLIHQIGNRSPQYIQKKFDGLMELLLYWRDETSHGSISRIDSDEAYIALGKLYRLSRFVSENLSSFI